MPDEQRVANNSQTYVADADTFEFETLEQKNGQATVIRFRLEDPKYHAGDVLVVLSGSDIHFHGMIGQLAEVGPSQAIIAVPCSPRRCSRSFQTHHLHSKIFTPARLCR
jgi:hypothetical protein